MIDAFVSVCVSKLGSEATVGSVLDVRVCWLLCEFESGELCDKRPLKG